MSDTIVQRIDTMGSRIDELEHSIADLMAQAAEQQQQQQAQAPAPGGADSEDGDAM